MSTCSDRHDPPRRCRCRVDTRAARTQRGDMLVEALVGLLLLCILGVGMVYVGTRVTGAQRDARIEGMAVISMRQLLREEGEALCAGPSTRPMVVGGDDLALSVDVEVDCAPETLVRVQAGGAGSTEVAMPRAVTLRLPPEALGLSADGVPLVVGTQQ